MKRTAGPVFLLIFCAAAAWTSGEPDNLAPGLYARIETKRGTMLFELDYASAPLTVANFAGLATGTLDNTAKGPGEPFYDGLTIHHLAKGYAVFTGDPAGDGTGGPGYTIPREPDGAYSAAEPGVLLMDGLASEAAGSRFFATISGDAFLDTKYTRFGRLVWGKPVLKKLRLGDTVTSIRILPIGAEAESLDFSRERWEQLVRAGKLAEIVRLAEIDPALADAVTDMGRGRTKTPTGIYYLTEREGTGEFPVAGDRISMNYTGTLLDGEVFDSTYSRGITFDFVLGTDSIIPGWIEMVAGMRPGELRRVVIPPAMAYGELGYGPIEPDSWLIFDMELVGFVEG